MKYLKRINESKTDYDFIYDCFAELIDNGVVEISDYQTELELAKKIYNEEYIKILESKFIKWLNEDIERELSF